ncbi:hypothetical protein EGW08_004909 [Elysia chlorotica]|uniref:YTH domain-containing protein n=1 Tax=Elysia chlorotica TaxID=188477 RepID=A0A433U0N5_ELYCH|nr:hypothetical protein EGW08_004909 [Elysia chlorotica]
MDESANTPSPEETTSFFAMKCADVESLQRCINASEWAYRRRNKQPQPHDLLVSAHEQGNVILVFSVNGQHGWHGFCQSCFKTETRTNELCRLKRGTYADANTVTMQSNTECSDSSVDQGGAWHHFPVQWLVHYQKFNTYTCLDFKHTEHLKLKDGSPVNKARNWQELTCDAGSELCSLIEDHHKFLTVRELEHQLQKMPESFFKDDQNISVLKEKETWQTVIAKTSKDLGKVHLACPFGSQRYNCSTPESDLDLFIVYQAKTVDLLGLDPPKQTIKNSHREDVDYSVLELQRYCELLVRGDAKCVETLFLSESPVVVAGSPEWRKLCSLRSLLLTGQCLEKYMKEIHGTTGLKQFQRWRDSNPETEELTPKLVKLGYIVMRLLQNARDMALLNDIIVFRDESSLEREELMAMRGGEFTYKKFMEIVCRYLGEIEKHKDQLEAETDKAKSSIQKWLIECRLQDLQPDLATGCT